MGLAAAIGVGAVASVAGGAIAAGGAKSAAKSSAAAADRSSEVQQQIYNQNAATLSPFIQRGNAAGGAINALLGLGGGPTNNAATQAMPAMQQGQQDGVFYGAHGQQVGGPLGMVLSKVGGQVASNFGVDDYSNVGGYIPGGITPEAYSNWGGMDANGMPGLPGPISGYGGGTFNMDGTVATPSAQDAANSAYEIFKRSTNYQGRLKEGASALNSMWAGGGAVKSGAAGKAFTKYGQDYAANELTNYMNMLGNQQNVGAGAASSQAGVGQNYANSIGNINMQNGANQANAALAGASAVGGGVGNITNLIGLGMGSGLFGKKG